LDLANAWLKMEGLQSEWLAPSPTDLKVPKQVYGAQYTPEITNRQLQFK